MAEEVGERYWKVFAPERTSFLNEEFLEEDRAWMFFPHPSIKIPDYSWFRQAANVISKYGEGRTTVNYYPDLQKCAEYLKTMSDHFEREGLQEPSLGQPSVWRTKKRKMTDIHHPTAEENMEPEPPRSPSQKRARFLDLLGKGASVTRASEAANVATSTVYRWRQKDDRFRTQWVEAYDRGTDRLEDRAFELAETVSERMLIFLLKCRRPQVYGDRQVVESSNVVYHIADQPLSEDEFEASLEEAPLPLTARS